MSDDRLRLVCPQCDYVIGVVPPERPPKEPLICSNCGATVYPHTPWSKALGWLRRWFRGERRR